VHCALCTVHCALCTVYCALCAVHLACVVVVVVREGVHGGGEIGEVHVDGAQADVTADLVLVVMPWLSRRKWIVIKDSN
jgi:hypothetical protein